MSLQDQNEFKARVFEWAGKLDVRVRALSIRQMQNKWASCSTAGNFSFSRELLDMERDLTDYVIVHELLHVRVPNHGKLWKSMMVAYLGDYEALEARLPAKTVLPENAVPHRGLSAMPFHARRRLRLTK